MSIFNTSLHSRSCQGRIAHGVGGSRNQTRSLQEHKFTKTALIKNHASSDRIQEGVFSHEATVACLSKNGAMGILLPTYAGRSPKWCTGRQVSMHLKFMRVKVLNQGTFSKNGTRLLDCTHTTRARFQICAVSMGVTIHKHVRS